jgi:hypothetical protein
VSAVMCEGSSLRGRRLTITVPRCCAVTVTYFECNTLRVSHRLHGRGRAETDRSNSSSLQQIPPRLGFSTAVRAQDAPWPTSGAGCGFRVVV